MASGLLKIERSGAGMQVICIMVHSLCATLSNVASL